MLHKILLGVAALGLAVLGLLYWHPWEAGRCEVCQRPMHKETFYRVELQGGTSTEVCCPRCGLRFQRGRRDVKGAKVADYLTRKPLDAKEAFYVESSEVHPCCSMDVTRRDATGGQYTLAWDRCLPSLVAFATREQAEEFRRSQGGVIRTYSELLREDE
jgi:hypothetical protein